jgi:hypothetical protein
MLADISYHEQTLSTRREAGKRLNGELRKSGRRTNDSSSIKAMNGTVPAVADSKRFPGFERLLAWFD